jgi:hypothetical protein
LTPNGKSVESQLLANFHRNLPTGVGLRLISLFRQIMVDHGKKSARGCIYELQDREG